ncbi:MAG: serine hydroxymethyltransferase, partial [Acidimicrobiia bacterium]
QALDRAGIELNYNSVPFDTRKPFDPSGIRLGTAAVTTRGLIEDHMPQIAAWMDDVVGVAEGGDEQVIDRVRSEISEFVEPFPIPGWPA